jgi:hypothetical protein
MKKLAIALLAAGCIGSPAFADEAELRQELEAMKALMKKQQAQIDALLAERHTAAAAAVPAPAAAQAAIPSAPLAAAAPAVQAAAVPAAAPAAPSDTATTFGGYGEIAYNRYKNDPSRDQADLKRFVVFLGHDFDERLSFHSEIEWEHAVTSATDRGESEIEQAYLNYKLTDRVNLKAGLFLMPFGFLNQNHEPPVFYGVERNEVETRIIPSTWREGGVGLYGSTDAGFAWDVGITTGFDFSKFDDASAPLSSIHQELQLAHAANLAGYGALNYRGIPGLTVGGGLFSGDSGQDNANFKQDSTQPNFAGIAGRVTLWDTHARWQHAGWDLQTVYARGTLGDAGRIDQVLQNFNAANQATRPYVSSQFDGWLVQGARTVWSRGDMSLTPFVRYEQYNTQAKMPVGFAADSANADRVTTVGLSFKPHPQVVLKADYQKYRDNTLNDRFNLGLGYMF